MSNFNSIYTPPQGPPQNRPPAEIYVAMGEENIFRLVHDFYAELERSSIRHLFPEDMQVAANRSAAFFVFWLGGPPLYQEQYGHPRLRQRHLPFAIDAEARQAWLAALKQTMQEADRKYQFPMEYFAVFWAAVEQLSSWMVNRAS